MHKQKDKTQNILFSSFHQQVISSHFPGSSGYNGRQISYTMNVHASCFLFLSEQMSSSRELTFGQFGSAVMVIHSQPTGSGSFPNPAYWYGYRMLESADAVPVVAALATSSAPYYFYAI